MYYGPNNNPRLSIGPRNQVTVDQAGKIHLIDDLEEYRKSVGPGTWNAVNKLADELREKKIKIGFFSSTPQGGEYPDLIPCQHLIGTSCDDVIRWSRSCESYPAKGSLIFAHPRLL